MESARSREGWRETIHRWLHENVADTRAPDGPAPRLYAAPFARVWDEILAEVERRRRWTLRHKDEELGIITVECRSLVLRLVDDLTVWVSLDDNALTRVEARSRSRVGKGDFGVNRRRIERLLGTLDRAVGAEVRVRGDATGGRDATAAGSGG